MDPDAILVTGGAGRLGRALGRLGCKAPGRDALDITVRTSIARAIRQSRPHLVINAAAYTNVDGAEAEAHRAHQINATGAGLIAEVCAQEDIPLIHISTDMVFSQGKPAQPVTEQAEPAPNSVYGQSKLDGELAVRAAGGRHSIARVSWLFSGEGESFISKILAVADQRDHLQLVDDEYGRPTHIDALAGHLLRLSDLMVAKEDVPTLLHLGPPEPVSRYGWALEIFDVSGECGGPAPEMTPVPGSTFPTPAQRARGLVLDVSLADGLLGSMPEWQPMSARVVRNFLGKA
ncbi:MAG TPA: NAD-dependent epimerase/dehydratase family protein [Henriciella marina]|uniref:SDR family oxidoreductase n=1 Tax=Henriciella sp. TaxID=1968823 RepID=UPI0017E9D5F3|nr:sugar nucleotide-binding protein [Henriciella sp.]HIG21715.1 NAD-dependent epimerase/dehydratase family protein [Henriciella sp.]HIK65325.1 NAD-dependent epimerase/dehydratase family protein [Henriciella marina]